MAADGWEMKQKRRRAAKKGKSASVKLIFDVREGKIFCILRVSLNAGQHFPTVERAMGKYATPTRTSPPTCEVQWEMDGEKER